MSSQINGSHSIHMLSIQIDTKSFEFGFLTLVQQHQIVLFVDEYFREIIFLVLRRLS